MGGNTFITAMLGAGERAASAEERLRRAAKLELHVEDVVASALQFEVTVTNTGAGHKLPTGVTEERQIWIEASVMDAAGQELAHFGQLDDHGVIADDTMILQTQFADATGKVTHRIWLAESVLTDRRIAPRATDSQEYSVELDPAASPARISVRLWYRSSHQDFIDELFSDTPERELVPQVLMAETEYVF